MTDAQIPRRSDAVPDITQLLERWQAGDANAAELIFAQALPQLRRIARGLLRRERPEHTLQATALVNEACLSLLSHPTAVPGNRAMFFGVMVREMKRRLVDHARARLATKRGGGRLVESLEIDIGSSASNESDEMIESLDCALASLAKEHPRIARVVNLRFFVGLTNDEVAEELGLSTRSIKRDWTFGKAWLAEALLRAR